MEDDFFIKTMYNNLFGGSNLGTANEYSGQYQSGGKPSIHDIFRGGKITGYEMMQTPVQMQDGTTQMQTEKVPMRGFLGTGTGNKGMNNRSLAGGINFFRPQQASVGRFTPLNIGNRNNAMMANMLRFNPNLKGLI